MNEVTQIQHESPFARPTFGEIAIAIAFALLSCAVMAGLLASGHVITGGENQVAADQLQYLSWIVSSSDHGFIQSLWDIPEQTGSHFIGPGFFVSGVLHRLGLGPILAFQVWKPIAILAVVVGFWLYVRRLVLPKNARLAAFALALFGLTPVGALAGWGQLAGGWRAQLEFAAGELFAAGWLWGYMMTAIAVALIPLTLLAAERASKGENGLRFSLLASASAFLCSWLQPWQGAEVVGAIVVCGVIAPDRLAPLGFIKRHGLIVASGLLPLLYYRWLSTSDPIWELAGKANNEVKLWSFGVWAAGFAPFLLAIPAWIRRPADWQETALRVVPILMLLEYFFIATTKSGTFPFHAVQGMGLFMAILTVQSALRVGSASWWRDHAWVAVAALILLCVPGTLHRLNLMRLEVHRSAQPYFLTDSEDLALKELASSSSAGGVLAPIKAALSVPARTARPVWVGQLSWTPDFRRRVAEAEALFDGRLDAGRSARIVKESGASVLYSDCGHRSDLTRKLGSLIQSTRRIGCATLYRVKTPVG